MGQVPIPVKHSSAQKSFKTHLVSKPDHNKITGAYNSWDVFSQRGADQIITTIKTIESGSLEPYIDKSNVNSNL